MAKIELADKPREEREPSVIGGFLVIPLNKQPDESWVREFGQPVERMTIQDSTIRIVLTEKVRRNISVVLDEVTDAIEKANDAYEVRQAESERNSEIARQQAKALKEKFDSDLDKWWAEKPPGD